MGWKNLSKTYFLLLKVMINVPKFRPFNAKTQTIILKPISNGRYRMIYNVSNKMIADALCHLSNFSKE